MNWKTKKVLFLGFCGGSVLLCLSVIAMRRQGDSRVPHQKVTTVASNSTSPESQVSNEDIKALRTEVERLKGDRQEAERRTAAMEQQLTSLRSQSTHAEQSQKDDALQLTPEEELQQVEAQSWVQVELFEGAIRAEAADPQWTSGAESALREVFLNHEITGLQLVDAQCRTTLCRLTLAHDSGVSPEEGFRTLLHHAPWQGQGFVQIGYGESTDVFVYLAREGYELPQIAK